MQSESIDLHTDTTASHHVLENPDILAEIFWHLDPYPEVESYTRNGVLDGYFQGGYAAGRAIPYIRTLTNAALVCKAFAEPASSVLWATLPKGLYPLLYPLREHASAGPIVEDELEQARVPAPGDMQGGTTEHIPAHAWERWEHCARRVRLVAIRDLESDWTQLSSLIPLSSYICAANRPLLPRLHTIVLASAGGGELSTQLLQVLAASSMIRAVSIRTVTVIPRPEFSSETLEDALSVDLDILAHSPSASQLRHLLITSPLPFRLAYSNSLRHVKAFHRLQTIYVGFVALDEHLKFLADLAALETLESMTVRSRSVLDPLDNASSSQNLELVAPLTRSSLGALAGFPTLRKIFLQDEPQQLIHMLQLIRSSTLECVWLNSTQSATTAFQPMLRSLISRPNIGASLREMRLTYSIGWDQGSSETIRTGSTALIYGSMGDIVGPLTALHALETLWLNIGGKLIRISDEDIAAMGNAWPRLQSIAISLSPVRMLPHQLEILLIAYEVTLDVAPTYTLSSLIRLAMKCRSLRNVDIFARPRDVSDAELVAIEELALEGGHDPQTVLRYLFPLSPDEHHWHEVSLADVQRLARALRCLFPRLGRPERQIEQDLLMQRLGEWEKEGKQSGVLEVLRELTAI